MTRHRPHHTRAAATALRLMAQLPPDVANCLSTVYLDHHLRVTNRHAVLQSHTNATCHSRHSVGQTSPSNSQEPNSP